MAKRILRLFAIILALALLALGLAWATSPDPKFNPASVETAILEPGLARIDKAVTLAQVRRSDGRVATLLVTGFQGETVRAIDLNAQLSSDETDPFAVLASLSKDRLTGLLAGPNGARSYDAADLLPAAPPGARHIGTGTNFPEHAEEASSPSVFQFPKFGGASGPRTTLEARPGTLLDYEVELCMRFDRRIVSVEDFDAATKGLFLCGDFTDRAKLTRLVDPDNLDSGRGFSDGKSWADFFPSGPFLVVPVDWREFVANERMTTGLNGAERQDARGREMTLDFRELTAKALGDMDQERFLYDGEYYTLTPDRAITTDMTLMSGTSEGVIFTQPTRADLIEGVLAYLATGGWLFGEALVPAVKETFINNEIASGHFLKAGDIVEHGSSRLGTIKVEVRGAGPQS